MSIALKFVKVITIQIAVIKKCFVILSSISFTFLFWKGVSIDNNKYVYCSVYEYSVKNLMKYNSSYNTQMYELSLDCKTRNILFRLSYYTYSTYKDRNYRQNKNNKSSCSPGGGFLSCCNYQLSLNMIRDSDFIKKL